MTYVNVLKKNINGDNGYVLANYDSENSVAFFADMPKNAIVDTIKVNGEYLEDIKFGVHIRYPRTRKDGEYRIVAVVEFNGYADSQLLQEVIAGNVENFEVFYHEEYFAEV